jgi:hypothetical protein
MPRHNGARPVYSVATGMPAINCGPPPITLTCCGFYVGDTPFYPESIRIITTGLAPCCNRYGDISSKLTFFGGDFNLQANVPRDSTGCYFSLLIDPGDLGTPTGFKRTYYSDPFCSVFESEDDVVIPITNQYRIGFRRVVDFTGCSLDQFEEIFMEQAVASAEPNILIATMPRLDCFNQFHPNELVCNFDFENPNPTCRTLRRGAEIAGGSVAMIPQDYAPHGGGGFGPEDFL